MTTLATAAEAIAAWDGGQPIQVVKIGPATAIQTVLWRRVIDLLRKFPPPSEGQHMIAGRTGTSVVDSRGIFTFAQFESWCWQNKIGFRDFAPPAATDEGGPMQWKAQDDGEWSAARQMAFSILREGFQFVIDRRRAADPGSTILVKKHG